MRTLKFIVDGQSLKTDPDCDFSGLVPGTSGYLRAEFLFSSEWDNCAKVVGFVQKPGGFECAPQLLRDGKSCLIPDDALTTKRFEIFVLGRDKSKKKLTTNKVTVTQYGGR